MRWLGTGLFIAGLLVGWFARDFIPARQFQQQGSSSQKHTENAGDNAKIIDQSATKTGTGVFPALLQQGKFAQVLVHLSEKEAQLDADSHSQLMGVVANFLENTQGQKLGLNSLGELIHFASSYLDTYVYDNRVRKALADLYLQHNKPDEAIRSLYKILEFPDSDEQSTLARSRIRTLVQGQRMSLVAESADLRLVVFYTWLLRLDPGNDGYRIALAQWKLRTGSLQQAEDLLAEISEIALLPQVTALSESIQLQRTDIPSYRLNGHLLTNAYINAASTKKLRLLIDTGASMTTINVRILELAGAENTGRTALISTASGRVNAPVYRLESLQIGNVILSQQLVLGMRIPVPGIDGLLGMDILGRTDLNLVYPRP